MASLHSLIQQQREDPALKKGHAGFKAWSDIHDCLNLLGWVDLELEEKDPRCPSEATKDMVTSYKEIL